MVWEKSGRNQMVEFLAGTLIENGGPEEEVNKFLEQTRREIKMKSKIHRMGDESARSKKARKYTNEGMYFRPADEHVQ